jgi:hypothetical protein
MSKVKIAELEERVAHLEGLLKQQDAINHQMVELVSSLRELVSNNQSSLLGLTNLVSANITALNHIELSDD